MLEGGSLGKFDFEVTDFFLFGSPLGLVLALRKTVVPSLDGERVLFHYVDQNLRRLYLQQRSHFPEKSCFKVDHYINLLL